MDDEKLITFYHLRWWWCDQLFIITIIAMMMTMSDQFFFDHNDGWGKKPQSNEGLCWKFFHLFWAWTIFRNRVLLEKIGFLSVPEVSNLAAIANQRFVESKTYGNENITSHSRTMHQEHKNKQMATGMKHLNLLLIIVNSQ